MKAQDKICAIESEEGEGIKWFMGDAPSSWDPIEYINKDALLEWLRKEYEAISWYYEKMKHVTGCVGDNSSFGKAEAYKKVIDKLNSM